jgi:ParB/RepB/Spo0J family partition protein
MWQYNGRLEEHITEDSCRGEIASFRSHGQRLPVLGRPLEADPEHDFEIVYGARRLFVARHLRAPLLLEVQRMSDLDAAVAADIENRQRKDISPYERALSYTRWLRSGLFRSQDDLARMLKTSPPQVSRLLKLAQIPSVILSAFDSPTNICETWAPALLAAWNDPKKRAVLGSRARVIARSETRPAAAVVFEQLLADSPSARPRRGADVMTVRDDVIIGNDGLSLFRIKYLRTTVALVLRRECLPPSTLEKIKQAVAKILQQEALEAAGDFDKAGQRGPDRPSLDDGRKDLSAWNSATA